MPTNLSESVVRLISFCAGPGIAAKYKNLRFEETGNLLPGFIVGNTDNQFVRKLRFGK